MNNEPEQPVEATSSEPDPRPPVVGISAKTEPKDILDGLVNDLNTLILISIAAVYYYDCFSLLFLLRFFGQNQSTAAGIRVVATTNVICILTHLFHSITQPAQREVWNHGGALVDFVGEKPASRFKLIVLDFMIVGLQILYLALFYKKLLLSGSTSAKAPTPAQDLDAEEAGISRADPPVHVENEDGIEMQSLLPSGASDAEHDPTQDKNTIILQKSDLREVFMNTARNAQTNESGAAVRRLVERVNMIRARRAALEARVAANANAV